MCPLMASAGESCETSSSTVDLIRALGTAEAYFSSLNAEGFSRSVEQSEQTIVCLGEELPLTLAAEFHRYQAIRFFVKQESTECMLSFAAARAIEPEYRFPAFLVPPDNPILDNYTAVDPSIGKTEEMNRPKHGYFQFDGSKGENRPTDFPTVVQLFDKKGLVQKTVYLRPGEPFFEYEKAKPRLANPPLLAGAGAAWVTAGVLYALAKRHRNVYDCVGEDCNILIQDDLDLKRRTVNRLSVASGTFGVVGLGLGASAFIVVRL